MIRRIALRPEAEAEIAESIDWYEARGKGLGSEFLRAVDAAIANVVRNPAAYPIVLGEVRRAPVRRFPYSVIYTADTEELLVIACFHTHRDPKRWQERL
jgi:plasmid stabilization system protein ParE